MFIKRNYLQPVFRSLFFAEDSSKAWLRVRWWNDRLLSRMNKFLRSVAFRLWSAKYLIRFYFPSFPFKDTCKFYYYIFNVIYKSIYIYKKKKKNRNETGPGYRSILSKARDKSLRVEPWRERERDCTFTIPDIPPLHGRKGRSGGFSRGKRIKGLISRLGGSSRSRPEPHRTRPRATPCPLRVASIYRHRDRVEIKGYSATLCYTILYTPQFYIYIPVGREIKPIT